jgi:lipopolysaccharide export system permease protein
MKQIHLMILKNCALVFLIILFFFVVLLELIDLFAYLWSYIDNHVLLGDILLVLLYFIPKCVSYVVPIALLFSISYTLGTLYANNELIAVLGGGMNFFTLIYPLILVGFLLGGFVFFFEDKVVIDSFKAKTQLQATILKRPEAKATSADLGFIDRQNDVLIKVDTFSAQDNAISGVLVYDRGRSRILYADRAAWDGKNWIMPNAWLYEYNAARTFLVGKRLTQYRAEEIRQSPEKFKLTTRKIEEMNMGAAAEWIEELESSGLPALAAQTGFFNKFSYALRVFMVAIIAATVGRAFRKNILLMCLLLSLVISVVFFVFQLLSDALAKNGIVPPFVGAFLPILVFAAVGVAMLARTRT